MKSALKRKEPPGNGAALSSGRIVPTGGKPDRTFWLHTRFGGKECQEKIWEKISGFVSII
jgi:hypothetical protein